MARKEDLRRQRKGTVINVTSRRQEETLIKAIFRVEKSIRRKFPQIQLCHDSKWMLHDVVSVLKEEFPEVDFMCNFKTTSMMPDGGILSIVDRNGKKKPILISEKKNQGTNDLRALEGRGRQAKGNAIERLGKNVIGFRTAMRSESIFPFVCFGDGCDFEARSTILDRVVTVAQFGSLNKTYLHKQNEGYFDRGSFYFREKEWTEKEMHKICLDIACRSIQYYFSKYRESSFS